MLDRSDVTDIFINRPGEFQVETIDCAQARQDAPELTEVLLWRLAQRIAGHRHQGISRVAPLLSASLPDGTRAQVIAPPATRCALAIALRKHVEGSDAGAI